MAYKEVTMFRTNTSTKNIKLFRGQREWSFCPENRKKKKNFLSVVSMLNKSQLSKSKLF